MGARHTYAHRSDEAGFTLVELITAIAILGIIAAPLAMSFISGLRIIGRADERLGDSRSALITASFFANDVSSANTVSRGNTNACGSFSGSQAGVVTFAWASATAAPGSAFNNKATYLVDSSDSTNRKLVRRFCANGAATPTKTSTAAISLSPSTAPAVTCYTAANAVDNTCSANTKWVKMLVTAKPNGGTPDNPSPTAFAYTLEGTRRSV
jgi:prepilin-type N-terminal cleavage/methylation domain-containing protein